MEPGAAPLVIHDTDSLRALVRGYTLVSDLTRGGWQPHRLALDLLTQLPSSAPAKPNPANVSRRGTFSFAQTVARGIDAESAGDVSSKRSAELAATIVEAARTLGPLQVLVLRSSSIAMSGEDRLVFSGLVEALRDTSIAVHEAFVEAGPVAEVPWIGHLVPGVLEPCLLERLEPSASLAAAMIELPGGHRLQPIEWSAAAANASRFDFDRLGGIPGLPNWVRAFAQLHGNHHFVDAEFLITQAWATFEAGGKQLAFALLGRAAEVSKGAVAQGTLMCHLQGMRIADLRFAEAAAEAPPSPSMPGPVRAFLLMARGWGCVLTNRAAEGERLLKEAHAIGVYQIDSDEHLYLDNIRALAHFRLGDVDQAFAIERRIAVTLASASDGDAQLEYVNALNLARVHTARGEPRSAHLEYRRAFATAAGTMVEGDLLYSCVALARSADALGDTQQARSEWLRAGLYWLSNPRQGTLSRRIAAIVGGRSWTDPVSAAQSVAEVLAEAVERHWPADRDPDGISVVRIRDGSTLPPGTAMYGWGGVFVLPMPGKATEERETAGVRLARAVATALRETHPNSRAPFGSVIGVPVRDGFGMPQTDLQAVAECLRLSVECAWLDGRRVDIDSAVEAALMVRLNPNVRDLAGDEYCLNLRFRRYRSPTPLVGSDARVVNASRSPISVARLSELMDVSPRELMSSVRALECSGVLDVYLQEIW